MSQLPQASLARASLIKMGVRIAIILALTTLASYLHIFRLMRDSPLSQLAQHVAERGQREQSVFLLAQDNRDDGQLIAHSEMRVESGKPPYDILENGEGGSKAGDFGTAAQRAHLRAIFERVKGRSPGQTVLELPANEEYLAVARLSGPGWNFITVLPEREVSSAALSAARYVLVFGLASLLLELVIVFWVLRELEQVKEPVVLEALLDEAVRDTGTSALAARELGGTLTVHSDGPGQGASFVLELPLYSTQGAS